jgi:hypothetical protein
MSTRVRHGEERKRCLTEKTNENRKLGEIRSTVAVAYEYRKGSMRIIEISSILHYEQYILASQAPNRPDQAIARANHVSIQPNIDNFLQSSCFKKLSDATIHKLRA